jgi:hypothetical protein
MRLLAEDNLLGKTLSFMMGLAENSSPTEIFMRDTSDKANLRGEVFL